MNNTTVAEAIADIHTWEVLFGADPAFWDQIDQALAAATDPDTLVARMHDNFAESVKKFVREELAGIADALDADIIEVDPASRPEGLADTRTRGWFTTEPEPCLYFPAGQPPLERLDAARKLAADLGVAA